MSADDFRSWNESMSRKYHPDDYHSSSSAIVRWIERSRVCEIFRQLGCEKDHRVLEVGVGVGTILAQIPSKTRAGIDLSSHYLSFARQRLPSDVQLIEGNAEELTKHFPPASFDRIYSSEVIEHVQHPDRVIAGMKALLAPGGRIVISVPNERLIDQCKALVRRLGLFRLFFPKLESCSEGNEWHLHIFTPKDIQKLFTDAGLTMEKLKGAPYSFLPLRYIASGR